MDNRWISIMDYAVKNDVSLSTIRRYIKSNRITYKKEQGKYLLLDSPHESMEPFSTGSLQDPSLENRVKILELKLNEALEHITELKMLMALYEDKIEYK